MKKKKSGVDFNALVQFRPGIDFGRLLASLEEEWKLPRNDVVRRLAIMSAFEISPDLYEPIAEAATFLGGVHGFEQASKIVNAALRGGNSQVQADPCIFTDPEKKKQFVHRVLCVVTGRFDYAQFFEDEEKRAEEEKGKQHIYERVTE